MSFSLNKAHVLGMIGTDPETKTIKTGKRVSAFNVATSHNWKKGDEWQEETTWHRVVAWELSDKMLQLLTKGTRVMVVGRIMNRKYKNENGEERQSSQILMEEVIPLGRSEKRAQPVPPKVSESNDDIPF